jgi:hypothetical protein
MTVEVLRLRDEQVRLATLLLAGHPEQHGLRMAIADSMSEELILEFPELWEKEESR